MQNQHIDRAHIGRLAAAAVIGRCPLAYLDLCHAAPPRITPEPNQSEKHSAPCCSRRNRPGLTPTLFRQILASVEEVPMQIEAAVFRKPHAPLTIETVDIDTPTAPRGAGAHRRDRRLPQRSACRGWCRTLSDRPADRARPRGRRHCRGGRRRRDQRARRRPCRRLPVGVLRHLPAMPVGPSEPVHRRHRHKA